MRRPNRYVYAVVLLLAFAAFAAAAQPNFSGNWKLNTAKSDFGEMPPPNSMTEAITHEEPNLKVSVQQSSDMGDFNYEAAYTTDGKECTNTMRENPSTSVVKWDGDALVFETEGNYAGTDLKINDRLTMSDDGKVLTLIRHISGGFGEVDQKYVLEKQ